MKTCKKCGIEKDETEFHKKKIKWLEGNCKVCKKIYSDERLAKDPSFYREEARLKAIEIRKTEEHKKYRKNYEKRNRKKISDYARELYGKKTRALELQKVWKSKNKDKLRKYNKTQRERFPFKVAARGYVCAAIKEGILIRPENCSECLKICKAEAHHEDYLKPLEVIWLCRACHAKEHRKT